MFPILLLLQAVLPVLTNADNYLCTDTFCSDATTTSACIPVPDGCNKTADGHIISGRYFASPRACSCCDYCLATLKEGDFCIVGVPGQLVPRTICGDGLTCNNETESCEKITDTPCTNAQQLHDDEIAEGQLGVAKWRPICDRQGDYANIHCIPGTICYCIDPDKGERIFGEALYNTPNVESAMTCGCAIAAWRAYQISPDVEVAHCLSNGSFDPLQCIGFNCTCVSPVDATMVDGKIVDLRALKPDHPECFDPLLHTPGIYERICERERLRLVTEKKKMEEEGFTVLYMLLPECTPDGMYARTQKTLDRSQICVNPSGQQIDQYGTSCGSTDCHCARTRWILQEAGITEIPTCCGDGTFRVWQCWRGHCYCVDNMGNQVGDEVMMKDVQNLSCYNATSCTDSCSHTIIDT